LLLKFCVLAALTGLDLAALTERELAALTGLDLAALTERELAALTGLDLAALTEREPDITERDLDKRDFDALTAGWRE
jgi:hypothetical protein